MDLTEEQRAVVQPLILVPRRRADGHVRLLLKDRVSLNGILRAMTTAASWHHPPDR